MDCSKTHKAIGLYLSGGLSEKGRHRFEEHIASCPACREEVRRYEKAYDLLDHVEEIKPSEDFLLKLNARIRRTHTAPAKRAGLRRIPVWVRGAAAVAACLVIAALVWVHFQTPADRGGSTAGLTAEEKEMVQNLDLLENLGTLEAAENGDIKVYSGKEFETAATLTGGGVDTSDMDLAETSNGHKP